MADNPIALLERLHTVQRFLGVELSPSNLSLKKIRELLKYYMYEYNVIA